MDKINRDYKELVKRLGGRRMDLCHYCGTCIAVCPQNALSPGKDEKPVYDEAKCVSCSLCYDFCSGIRVDGEGIQKSFFTGAIKDDILGPYLKTYIGCSTIREIRLRGASGGMVTGLLSYLLKNGVIDGAIVVGRRQEEPFLHEVTLTKNIEELKNCSQSKYCYLPTNAFFKKLWYELGGEKGSYAVVALPCQIHAIREMQREKIKYVKNVKYVFGLICGYNMSIEATEFVRKKLRIRKEEVEKVLYRDLAWPGGMTFHLKNGAKRGIDLFHYHYLNAVFLPTRCRVCSDFFAEYADISFGDSWLKELYSADQENLGWSSIIARTKGGEDLLQRALNSGDVYLQTVDKEKIEESFPFNIKYKKRGITVRMKMARHIPDYNGKIPASGEITVYEKIYHVIYGVLLIFVSTRIFKALIYFVPLKILRLSIQITKRIMGYPENARDLVIKKKRKNLTRFARKFKISETWERVKSEYKYFTCKGWKIDEVGKFWDSVSDYDDINEKTYSYYRRFIDGYRVSTIPDKSYVLEVTPRTGNGTLYFYKKGKISKAVGADVSQLQIEIYKQNLSQHSINYQSVVLKDYHFPWEDNHFDAVLSFETVEHMGYPGKFVSEIGRVLKPGGELILTSPNILWEPVHWIAAIFGLHHSEGPHNFLKRKQLCSYFEKAGLEVEKEIATVLIPGGPEKLVHLGEWMEKNLPEVLKRTLALRRVFRCRKK